MSGLGRATCTATRRGSIVRRVMAGLLFASPSTSAHFVLQSPASWMSQNTLGDPQKLGPCGDEGGGTPTATVTTFAPGETISITIKETVFHPGHYRVALAVDSRDELPAEPEVTPATTPCGSVPIDSSPEFPVLADGALQHTSAFSGPQTIEITLPSDVTCTHCTLQVIEFMSNHALNKPGGCFYHHCADIAIVASGGGAPGTGGSAGFGGTTAKAAGGTTIGGRTGLGSGGRSNGTGGVEIGGRQQSGGVAATGGMQAFTGGRSNLGTGGSPGLTGGTQAQTGGTSTQTGGTPAQTGGTRSAIGGTGLEGSGGSGTHRPAGTSGGTAAGSTILATTGTVVEGEQQPTGCSCSVPGEPRGAWLNPVIGLLVSLMLLRARTKARLASRTDLHLQRAAGACPAPRSDPSA